MHTMLDGLSVSLTGFPDQVAETDRIERRVSLESALSVT
jgi:hypothetical protein